MGTSLDKGQHSDERSLTRGPTNLSHTLLKLRAVRANGDFDEYWTFHLDRERQRVHQTRYTNGIIPLAA